MASCPYCMESVQDGAQKCRHCGSWLTEAPANGSGGRERVVYIVDRDTVRFAKFAFAILSIFALVGGFLYGCKVEDSAEQVDAAKDLAIAAKEEADKARGDAASIRDEVLGHRASIVEIKKQITGDAKDAENALRQIRRYQSEAEVSLGEINSPAISEQQIEEIVDRVIMTRFDGVLSAEQLAKLEAGLASQGVSLSDLLDQPALASLSIKDLWQDLAAPTTPITIALIADPVATELPQLENRIAAESAKDTTAGDHGTAVASLIAAIARNAEILSIPALNATGSGGLVDIIRAINQSIETGARLICIPLGTKTESPAMRDSIESADQRGVLVIAPSGNALGSETTEVDFPAAYPSVISVGGSTNDGGTKAPFSPSGEKVDLFAPGENIRVLTSRGETIQLSGTSFSAAIVCGVAGMILSVRPDLSPEQVQGILKDTAKPIEGAPGARGLDAEAAIRAALAFSN